MHASGPVPLSLVQEDRSGPYIVSFFTNHPAPSGYFVPPERPQVFFRMPGLTALCPPAGEFLSLLYLPVTHIHILCVVELFQDPVIPAALLIDRLFLPVAGMEAAHDEGVIGMRLADTVKLPHGLGHAAVCHMDRAPCLFLQVFYDLPPTVFINAAPAMDLTFGFHPHKGPFF